MRSFDLMDASRSRLHRAEVRTFHPFHSVYHSTLSIIMASICPVELLDEILRAAQVHDLPFAEQAQVEGNAEVATAVSQVCRHWRHTALRIASLWTYIPCIGGQSKRAAPLSESIKRANGRLLTIFLQLPGASTPHDLSLITELANKHLSRVQILSVDVVDSDQGEYWSKRGRGQRSLSAIIDAQRAPNLRSLSFSADTFTEYCAVSVSPGYFENGFISLVNMRISGMHSTVYPDTVRGLTSATLDNIPLASAYKFVLVPSALTLTSLTLGKRVEKAHEQDVGFGVVLPALHTLVSSHDSVALTKLFAPHVKVLKLHHYGIRVIRNILNLLNFGRKSLTEVEDLYVHVYSTPAMGRHLDIMMKRLVLALPNVTRVQLDGPVRPFKTLVTPWRNKLAEDVRNNWPKLQHVIVGSEDARTMVSGALEEAGRGEVNVSMRSRGHKETWSGRHDVRKRYYNVSDLITGGGPKLPLD